jgi:hypothetical protein
MSSQTVLGTTTPATLLGVLDSVVVHQALYAATALGVPDLLLDQPRTTADLAHELEVNEEALYRILRALAGEGIFEETRHRTFANNDVSHFLRTGVPGSVRSILAFKGSFYFFAPFGDILYSIQTGQSARTKTLGMNGFEYLREHPEVARVFDDAMTNISELSASAIASAYDFGRWGSLMDIGGGNGILLAAILKAHRGLRGVLADQPHVLERARQRGFLGGELEARSTMLDCDFFRQVPSGCRAFIMKHVIVDWEDGSAHAILANCRKAIPADGVLLIVDFALPEGNRHSTGKLADIAMLVLTGGRVRTMPEYRELLAGTGFTLNRVIPVPGDLIIFEAMPSASTMAGN